MSDLSAIPIVRLVVVGDDPKVEPIADLRMQRIEQFLGTRNLAANTKRNYERQLRYFLDWLDKDWHTITLNDLKNYKTHLEGKNLEQGSIGAYITSVKSCVHLDGQGRVSRKKSRCGSRDSGYTRRSRQESGKFMLWQRSLRHCRRGAMPRPGTGPSSVYWSTLA